MELNKKLELIGNNIRSHRNKAKLMQKELADATGLSIPTVCRIESGKDSKISSLINIADKLNTKIEVLVK